ncbi:MAG: PP0621 family protein [Pseudomonadota bacterium]
MSRLLFWIALIGLVILALRSKSTRGARPPQDARHGAGAPPPAEAMACCFHCGVYFPASEAVRADGHDYCSAAHVRLPPK